MNVDSIKSMVTQKFGRTGLTVQKYSPEILLGLGIVGGVVAAVMAAKATMKLETIVEDHSYSLDELKLKSYDHEEEKQKEKAMVYVKTGVRISKLYGPSVGLGVLSIGAILSSHGVMANRQVALVAAYNLLSQGYQSYRDRVVEELGEEADMKYHLGLREETVVEETIDENGKTKKTKKKALVAKGTMPSMYARCFDNTNIMARSDRLLNRAFLESQQRFANDLLILRGHLFLNEVYERLGFNPTPEGQLVGWVLQEPEIMEEEKRDGFVSFGLKHSDRPADQEFMQGVNDAIWLDFNVDGIIYDLI